MMEFPHPVNDEALQKIVEKFGEPVAHDRKTFLFDRITMLEQKAMKEIANAAKQPATVSLVDEGEVKVFSDGTRYRVTPKGWQKITD